MSLIRDLNYRNNFRNVCLDFLGVDEVWAFHLYLDDYLISSYGRIKSLKTNKIMKLQTNRNGYLGVNVQFIDIGRRFVLIHRLVCETFFSYMGIRNYFYEVNHIDGNKQNNKLSNLEWLTRDENLKHAKQNKFSYTKYGENNPNSKLKDKDLYDIIELKSLGFTLNSIAKSYNVIPHTITKAIKKRGINEQNSKNT